jgi:hypothetical protein
MMLGMKVDVDGQPISTYVHDDILILRYVSLPCETVAGYVLSIRKGIIACKLGT